MNLKVLFFVVLLGSSAATKSSAEVHAKISFDYKFQGENYEVNQDFSISNVIAADQTRKFPSAVPTDPITEIDIRTRYDERLLITFWVTAKVVGPEPRVNLCTIFIPVPDEISGENAVTIFPKIYPDLKAWLSENGIILNTIKITYTLFAVDEVAHSIHFKYTFKEKEDTKIFRFSMKKFMHEVDKQCFDFKSDDLIKKICIDRWEINPETSTEKKFSTIITLIGNNKDLLGRFSAVETENVTKYLLMKAYIPMYYVSSNVYYVSSIWYYRGPH